MRTPEADRSITESAVLQARIRAPKGETAQHIARELKLQQKFPEFRGNRRRGHQTGGGNPEDIHQGKGSVRLFIMRRPAGRRR